MNLEDTILKLYDVGGIKFGEFKMRTGEMSPVYVDMRVIWSYPDIVVKTILLYLEIYAITNKLLVLFKCFVLSF